jgi:RHS repeat-associated protein
MRVLDDSLVQSRRRSGVSRSACGSPVGRFRKARPARLSSYPLSLQHHGKKSRTTSEDPFGNLLAQSGALAEANVYRFSSKEHHPTSGLVYYLYRFYDPGLQRWVNRDPLTDLGFRRVGDSRLGGAEFELNLYEYCLNDPVCKIDPLGLWFDSITGYMRGCAEMHALGSDRYADCVCAPVTTGNEDSNACKNAIKKCGSLLAKGSKNKAVDPYSFCVCMCQLANKTQCPKSNCNNACSFLAPKK